MTLNYSTRIASAASLPEALAVVGEGIDYILDLLTSQPEQLAPADPWGTWQPQAPAAEPLPASVAEVAESRPAPVPATILAELRERIQRETDEDERTALQARLRLLQDEGVVPADLTVPEGRRERIEVTEDEVRVELPPPDAARRDARDRFTRMHQLHEFIGGHDPALKLQPQDAKRAFIHGGPLWLYHYDRASVMDMPIDWRRAFVDDIAQDSPATAQEVGRDILMVRGDADHNNLDVAYDANLSR